MSEKPAIKGAENLNIFEGWKLAATNEPVDAAALRPGDRLISPGGLTGRVWQAPDEGGSGDEFDDFEDEGGFTIEDECGLWAK